jgi:hypothetical protein
MKDVPRQQFRSAAHVSGVATAKPKDYEASSEIDAESEYAAWAVMRNTEQPLNVGDLLDSGEGRLRICKYVGFEEARWFVPEPQQASFVPPPDAPPEAPQMQA